MTQFLDYDLQLKDVVTGNTITTAGGTLTVCKSGSPDKQTLYDPTANYASLANPVSLTRGGARFSVASSVSLVDVYGFAPGGQYVIATGLSAGGQSEIAVPTFTKRQVAVVPFSATDSTAATEKDTGMDLPTNAILMPREMGVYVVGAQSSVTIDMGLLSTESGGDADGFINGADCATAGFRGVAHTWSTSTGCVTASLYGALIEDFAAGSASTDRGAYNLKGHRCDGTAKSLSYTLATGASSANGFVHLPYALP